MASSFLYSTCVCCRTDEASRLQRRPGEKSPQTEADALALLLQHSVLWNDATRGAYRAQRRKDETV
jgi:hypothetical protein